MIAHAGQVEVNGGKLVYEVTGSGEPVVLVHGFGLDMRMWDDQVAALAPHFQVIRYDLRGFGRSDPPTDRAYTPSGDLKALLDHLGIERAAVVGLSLGGNAAIQFAENYPDATRALVLIDAVVGGWTWSQDQRGLDGEVWRAARTDGVAIGLQRWLDHPLFAPANENPEVARRLAEMVHAYSGYHWTHEDPQEWKDPPEIEGLGSITAPTLVIVGDRDLPDFVAIAHALAERIPHAEEAVLPGVGHMANMEAPAQVNELLLQFLARTLQPA